jgi:hypothetical protein
VKAENKAGLIILVIVSILSLILPLSLCSCGSSFSYQGSLNGNWSGKLTVLSRAIPIGGTIAITIDSKGVVSGNVGASSGVSPAVIKAQVDSNGNLTGTVTFTLSGTNFISNWQGKITRSGDSLSIQGNWNSEHGSGSFSGTGTRSKE